MRLTPLFAATTFTAVLSTAALTGPASGSPGGVARSLEPSARTAASSYDLYLDFNGSNAGTPDMSSSGSAPVSTSVASSDGGRVVAVSKGAGQAARMEPFDPETPAELAVVVARPEGNGDPFAPRTGDFAFGASFNLDPRSQGSSVDNGNNLFQRGLYSDDAQYKLQIDDGRVSCRVAGSSGAVQVKASRAVRSGAWHRVRCLRDSNVVKLVVVELTADGPVSRSWTQSGPIGDLAFSARPPLSVGGKVDRTGAVVKSSSDQFNGRVDNVFFRRISG
ncbi:MAG: hypothetical protein AVDCRST_MAG47-2448 [uncultured Nocardioidaceae bacterium]|uniref:Laminin G domain-containing protein n=1 Tax=uncultured Nocardioidaceae bacterium TaxID=253824 RepID=A0A6J4NJL9_9ACTN|nr:MAG: hypothetical protein AVDCRST_MAG47-2448 [uncultured Nocardioidaceae bacterium]